MIISPLHSGGGHVGHGTMWMSKDNLRGSMLSFHCVSPHNWSHPSALSALLAEPLYWTAVSLLNRDAHLIVVHCNWTNYMIFELNWSSFSSHLSNGPVPPLFMFSFEPLKKCLLSHYILSLICLIFNFYAPVLLTGCVHNQFYWHIQVLDKPPA